MSHTRGKSQGTKGVLARESCTGTRLVSPAKGSKKKKMDASRTGPQEIKFSILGYIIVDTDDILSSTAQRKQLKWEIYYYILFKKPKYMK